MAEALLSYALTTVARVKARLTITVSAHDTVLMYLINGATDFIEGECNRRFKETTYTNEVYSIPNAGNGFLVLKQFPISTVSSLQFRAGLKSNPNWTEFVTDTWELMEDGAPGIIQIYGAFIQGLNSVRVTYTAGYKINFSNYGDMTTHTLPADLTDLTERLAVKSFKRRESEGKEREVMANSMTIWKDLLSPEDLDVINRYRRVNFF